MSTLLFKPPALDQMSSSSDDFVSARASPTSSSDTPPNTADNPIIMENTNPPNNYTSYTSSSEDENSSSIPPPETHDNNGEKLSWPSLNTAFAALQEFTKENGFTVKKSTSKKDHGRTIMQCIHCVHGGQRNTTKVITLNRKRRSRSLIGDEPCPFKAYLKEQKETKLWLLDLKRGDHNHAAADRANVYSTHRRNALKAQPDILHHISTDVDT